MSKGKPKEHKGKKLFKRIVKHLTHKSHHESTHSEAGHHHGAGKVSHPRSHSPTKHK